MANLKIAWGNVANFGNATFLGAPPESFEGEYMFDTSPANTTKPNGAVTFDFGAAVNIKAILVAGSNVSSPTNYFVAADSVAYPGGGSPYIKNLTQAATSLDEIDETYRYWWFSFQQGSPAPQVGKLALFGNYVELDKNYLVNHRTGNEAGNTIVSGAKGAQSKNNDYIREIRQYPFRYTDLTQAQHFDVDLRVAGECAIFDDKFNKPLYGYIDMRSGIDAERAEKYSFDVNFTEYI